MSVKTFQLTPVDVIPSKNTLYVGIVTEFAESECASCLVQVDGVKPKSIRVGLRRAIDSLKLPVSDVMRGEQVYLTRIALEVNN